MCGIIGAISEYNIKKVLLNGLTKLEYRGYDSSGLALISKNGNFYYFRKVGKVQSLIESISKNLSGYIGIAHTRWATHGIPTEKNAHPQISENIVIVHNGIIENYIQLKSKLRSLGYNFISDTDTEVIAHLVHREQKRTRKNLVDIIRKVVKYLRGSYGIAVMDIYNPKFLVVAKLKSPLVIGLGTKGNFISSDQIALLFLAKKFIFLEDGDVAEVTDKKVKIWDKFGKSVDREETLCSSIINRNTEKGTFHHYMEKEIFEQPKVLEEIISERFNQNNIILPELDKISEKFLKKIQYIQIIACGTSYHSAMVSRYWFESIANIPCDVEIASEFRYRNPVIRPKSLLILISQSGETADTLESLRLAKNIGGYFFSLAICNISNSSLARESDISIITKAGIEISVASTKSFTTQLLILLILVIKIGKFKIISLQRERKIAHILQNLPSQLERMLSCNHSIKNLSMKLFNKNQILFLGRGNLYPIAMEGALKLKEISYIHAVAYAAGELKHGPLALIDINVPVVVVASKNFLLDKLISNIQEVWTRGGDLYIFADEKIKLLPEKRIEIISLPHVSDIVAPIFYTIPLQLLAYYIALIKGTEIDQPRNLAKSVTVE